MTPIHIVCNVVGCFFHLTFIGLKKYDCCLLFSDNPIRFFIRCKVRGNIRHACYRFFGLYDQNYLSTGVACVLVAALLTVTSHTPQNISTTAAILAGVMRSSPRQMPVAVATTG